MNRRIVASSRGGPEVLGIVRESLPKPKQGEVRIKILATGVSYADLLMREGVHPETPRGPITLGWDVVGVVDEFGPGVADFERGQMVAGLPMLGGYADYICLPQDQVVSVPAALDPVEAVAMVLNYVTAYQMLHRTAKLTRGQSILIHGAAGGIGTALLQLGQLVGVTMYGTASKESHHAVKALGGIPIDYKRVDFVDEITRLTDGGVNAVFDGIGGAHVWRSFKALRPGGVVVAYGLTSSLRGGRLAGGHRHRFKGLMRPVLYGIAATILPGRRRILPYSIQRRMWRKPSEFREDLTTLFELLRDGEIKPVIAAKLPLEEARKAHEMLAAGSVTGKIILVCGDEYA